jgi:hypothetical protein
MQILEQLRQQRQRFGRNRHREDPKRLLELLQPRPGRAAIARLARTAALVVAFSDVGSLLGGGARREVGLQPRHQHPSPGQEVVLVDLKVAASPQKTPSRPTHVSPSSRRVLDRAAYVGVHVEGFFDERDRLGLKVVFFQSGLRLLGRAFRRDDGHGREDGARRRLTHSAVQHSHAQRGQLVEFAGGQGLQNRQVYGG